MMSITCPKEGDVFYDLGSGTGKAVILAAAHGPFKRCTGIDIVEDLTQSAQATADRYHIEIKPQFGDAKKDQQVNFIHGDMFEQDLSDGDIFFTHCTCFDDAMMDRMSKKLEECKPGTRVVTVTKGLTSPEFELTQTTPFRMAWGEATLCFYKRK
jgi:ubiquinone/menaquinone biosynthesis C-methylase UbiE